MAKLVGQQQIYFVFRQNPAQKSFQYQVSNVFTYCPVGNTCKSGLAMTSGESQLHFCNPPRKSSGCTCISGCKNHMKVGASHDQMDAYCSGLFRSNASVQGHILHTDMCQRDWQQCLISRLLHITSEISLFGCVYTKLITVRDVPHLAYSATHFLLGF